MIQFYEITFCNLEGKQETFSVFVDWKQLQLNYKVSLSYSGGTIKNAKEKVGKLIIFITQFLFLLVELEVKNCLECTWFICKYVFVIKKKKIKI